MQGLSEQVIEKLAAVFPEVITESLDEEGNTRRAVDIDRLKMLLTGEEPSGKEYYAFTWAGKRRAELEAARPTDKVLRPDVEGSVRFGETENLYIEGDNLEALKILRKSYLHRVKMIYIDPPYNTGHDFIYRDNLREKADVDRQRFLFGDDGLRNFSAKSYAENKKANPRYHSDWCSMIYPRLKVAKDFLTEDGVIFISIDDNEVMNLRKICDEIFGEDNFRNQIVVRRGAKSVQAQFDTWDKLGRDYEYILLYTRNSSYRFPQQLRELDEQRCGTWNNHWRGTDRPTMRYELFGISPTSGQWRWSKERSYIAIENYNRMLSEIGSNPTQEQIDEWYSRQPETIDLLRLSEQGKPEHYIPPTNTTLLNSSWMDLLAGSSSEITALFGAKVFDTPKLTALIMRMLKFTTDDAIVLDFFAGSSTTAHAVMLANSQDFGHRKFIMIQIPDPTPQNSEAAKSGFSTISQIGQERIRRAANSLIGDTGFRLLKIDSSNLNPDVYTAPDEFTHEKLDSLVHNIKPDRSALDLLFMCITDSGLPLSLPYTAETFEGFTIHFYGGKTLAACFDKNLSESLITHLAELKPDRAVFRDSCFADSAAKINLEQLFRHYAPKTKVNIL